MMFGQPPKKSKENTSNFFPNFRTNPKVLIHLNLKNSQRHNHIAKKIFQSLHMAKINPKPHLPYKWSPTQAWKGLLEELGHEMH